MSLQRPNEYKRIISNNQPLFPVPRKLGPIAFNGCSLILGVNTGRVVEKIFQNGLKYSFDTS